MWCSAMLLSWLPMASLPAEWARPNLKGWTSQGTSPIHAMKLGNQMMETSWQCPTEEKALQYLLTTTTNALYPLMGAQPLPGTEGFAA